VKKATRAWTDGSSVRFFGVCRELFSQGQLFPFARFTLTRSPYRRQAVLSSVSTCPFIVLRPYLLHVRVVGLVI